MKELLSSSFTGVLRKQHSISLCQGRFRLARVSVRALRDNWRSVYGARLCEENWTRPESKWAVDHWRAFVDLYTLLANSRCGLPSPWVANCSKNAPFEYASTTHHHHHSFTTMFASVNLIFHSTIFSTCYPQVPSSSSTLLHVDTECFKLMIKLICCQ